MKNRTWTSLLFVGLIAMGAASLTACGGGGGSVMQPPPVDPVDPPVDPVDPPVDPVDPPVDPVDPPIDPVDPVDPPTSSYSVGPYAINGIDKIPQSMVKLTREEMQRKFVIGDLDKEHAGQVGTIACRSYIQSGDCGSQAGKFRSQGGTVTTETGTSPFAKVVSDYDSQDQIQWLVGEIARMPEVKIVNHSHVMNDASLVGDGNFPYLVINSVGNGGGNASWYDELISAADKVTTEKAIAAGRLIFIGGWDKDANGNYIRHQRSNSCRGDGIREGCIWAQFDFSGYGGGTSYSAPQFAAALASVLAVAPETTPENLAKFGKACVKKRGEGIEGLLRVSGGLGVADFACVGDVVTAMANLPAGGTTNVTVNGKPVTLSGREIVLSFAGGSVDISEGTDGLFFSTVPNGGETVLFVTGYREGDLFAFLTAGTRDDFFGFRKEHRQVRQSGVTAGHENLFLTFTEQVSDGGSIITGATGRSLTVTAQKTVTLTENTALTMAAAADRFLGGEASIPLGTMTLDEGAWHPRFSLATETEIIPEVVFRTKAEVTDDEDYTLGAGLRLAF